MLRIFSWNVNGLRAAINKGALQKFIEEEKPDILCLQEIKARPDQVLYDFENYEEFWFPAERPGYSGTAILVSSADLELQNVIRWSAGRTALTGEPVGRVRNIRLGAVQPGIIPRKRHFGHPRQ